VTRTQVLSAASSPFPRREQARSEQVSSGVRVRYAAGTGFVWMRVRLSIMSRVSLGTSENDRDETIRAASGPYRLSPSDLLETVATPPRITNDSACPALRYRLSRLNLCTSRRARILRTATVTLFPLSLSRKRQRQRGGSRSSLEMNTSFAGEPRRSPP